LIQAIGRNPLADSEIFGINSGATLFASTTCASGTRVRTTDAPSTWPRRSPRSSQSARCCACSWRARKTSRHSAAELGTETRWHRRYLM